MEQSNTRQVWGSDFMDTHIPRLLADYRLSCEQEGSCCNYHLYSRSSSREISRSLVLSFDPFARNLYLARFYPELENRSKSRYLSASTLYLMIQHAGHLHCDTGCGICLTCKQEVFHSFYSHLPDYAFSIRTERSKEEIELRGWYHPLPLDLSVVEVEDS